MTVTRYGLVRGRPIAVSTIAAYMPDNYHVIGEADYDGWHCVVIAGHDHAGWTLDDYVIPRLASGLYGCEEVDLSHPVMKRIEVTHVRPSS